MAERFTFTIEKHHPQAYGHQMFELLWEKSNIDIREADQVFAEICRVIPGELFLDSPAWRSCWGGPAPISIRKYTNQVKA